MLVESEITTAYIGLGSNLGDRAGNLLLGVRGLTEASFIVHKLSAVYETEPVGVDGHGPYLNMVAEIKVAGVTPQQMMARMLRIEYLLGRRDKLFRHPRTLDLDLLMFGDQIVETELVTLPHPSLHLRRFVLVPFAEIAPHAVHPVFKKEIAELLAEVKDGAGVQRWNPNGADETGLDEIEAEMLSE